MKVSKFKKVNENILLEYIYDNSNLISESYSIFKNNNDGVRSFISASYSTMRKNQQLGLNQRSSTVDNKNIDMNQMVKLDYVESQYVRYNSGLLFISRKDYPTSIPIRYDSIRVHVPVNYTFEGHIGFYIKIYTLDYTNENFIEMSNYFFNMTDINQINNIEYNSNPLTYDETNWGKYIEIQFPSPNKVSDQRKNGSTRPNTINYNLTNGVGLSKNAPVLVDFHFIESLNVKDNAVFFIIGPEVSASFPHSPDFEKFGVVIEPSTQGDFFLIYPTFNGSIGEFNQWMEESIIDGNRYYLEYLIDVNEKNSRISSQKIIITEDFIEEIEYRPILKYTTTTAIIDVTCNLIDAVDESKVTRQASYGMVQDEVSKYSRYLSKINLRKANKEQVHKIKTINAPNTGDSVGVSTELSVLKSSFIVYSKNYNITTDDTTINYKGKQWLANRSTVIDIFPFDNIIVFKTIIVDTIDGFKPFDYTQYKDITLNIRSDSKKMSFGVYNDSDINDKANGSIVFRLKEGNYSSIKKIYQNGFSNFYITGTKNDIESIIYTGGINPWNSNSNKRLLDRAFENQPRIKPVILEAVPTKDIKEIEEVKKVIEEETSIDKSTDVSGDNIARKQNVVYKQNISPDQLKRILLSKLKIKWKPYWDSPIKMFQKSYEYQYKDKGDGYLTPGDIRRFAILMRENGFMSKLDVDKGKGKLSIFTQREIDILLGYFKIFNFNPMDDDIIDYIKKEGNITDWLNNGLDSKKGKMGAQSYISLSIGVNTPPDFETYEIIKEIVSLENAENNKKSKNSIKSEKSDKFRRNNPT